MITQQSTSSILSTRFSVLTNTPNNTVTSVTKPSTITTTAIKNTTKISTVATRSSTTTTTSMQNTTTMTQSSTSTTTDLKNTAKISTATTQNSTSTIPTRTVTSSMVKTQYSSALTSNSQMYCRTSICAIPNTYFQAIQLNVSISGTYTFVCNSSIDTYGFLYYNTFDPNYPPANLIILDDDGGGNYQFQLTAHLQISSRYILVVTTFNQNITGPFTITATGVSSIDLSSINVSSNSSVVQSQYLSTLNSSSAKYCRTGDCSSSQDYYYYSAILLNVNTTGYYTINSQSNMNTFGYIYVDSFNASVPLQNMYFYNDDGGGNSQFTFDLSIDATAKCILVVTTYSPNVLGAFSIISYGSGPIQFTIQQQ
ncbi:unnamed protein product [Adineta steineri]|uniref:Uncharacterized protein n=1 Tax=Adineta steineri TaxID=433720 RepID=A0A814G757_9BILA|nr:unnamed protein product [Adineta steineri]CAF0994951.1 unnamed protein product [Adineta steineri]